MKLFMYGKLLKSLWHEGSIDRSPQYCGQSRYFDAVHLTMSVTEKNLRRYGAGIKEIMNEGEVTRVPWCPGK